MPNAQALMRATGANRGRRAPSAFWYDTTDENLQTEPGRRAGFEGVFVCSRGCLSNVERRSLRTSS
jgi:hypothetical protein